MSISLTNENKNSVSLSLENKDAGLIWDNADFSWDDGSGTWDVPNAGLSLEAKNSISLTNETKS